RNHVVSSRSHPLEAAPAARNRSVTAATGTSHTSTLCWRMSSARVRNGPSKAGSCTANGSVMGGSPGRDPHALPGERERLAGDVVRLRRSLGQGFLEVPLVGPE